MKKQKKIPKLIRHMHSYMAGPQWALLRKLWAVQEARSAK